MRHEMAKQPRIMSKIVSAAHDETSDHLSVRAEDELGTSVALGALPLIVGQGKRMKTRTMTAKRGVGPRKGEHFIMRAEHIMRDPDQPNLIPLIEGSPERFHRETMIDIFVERSAHRMMLECYQWKIEIVRGSNPF